MTVDGAGESGSTGQTWKRIVLWNKVGSDCPFVQRDKIALVEKGIPFEEKQVELAADKRSAEFLDMYASMALDPKARKKEMGKVPILEHGEPGSPDYVKLIESNVIMEYIEDAWGDVGPRLRPRDPKAAAAMRMFSEAFSSMMPMKLIFGKSVEDLQGSLRAYVEGMRMADRCLQLYGLEGGPFVLGADFSQAECMAAPFVMRADVHLQEFRGVDPKKLAVDLGCHRLHTWFCAVLNHPSVVKTSEGFDPQGIKKVHPEWFSCDAHLTYKVVDGEVVFE